MITDPIAAVLIGAIDGTVLSSPEAEFIRNSRPAGLTLFRRNTPTHADVRTLTQSIQKLYPADHPSIVSIDQEGGRVARIKGIPFDPGSALGLAGGGTGIAELAVIQEAARRQGEALLDLGINVNFAPVCDVLQTGQTQCIGDRAFATTPDAVTLRAGAFLAGLNQARVLGCLKHFPGQGAAAEDTHESGSVIRKTAEELLSCDLMPFTRLLKEAPIVMLSHCIYPEADAREASRSPYWVQEVLRGTLAYRGLIVSDDMTMGAIALGKGGWQAAMVDSLNAGVDALLISSGFDMWRQVHSHLTAAAAADPALMRKIVAAGARVSEFRRRLALPGF